MYERPPLALAKPVTAFHEGRSFVVHRRRDFRVSASAAPAFTFPLPPSPMHTSYHQLPASLRRAGPVPRVARMRAWTGRDGAARTRAADAGSRQRDTRRSGIGTNRSIGTDLDRDASA